MTFSKILVATDFSKSADVALASAFSLARALGASVHVLHVVEDPLLSTVWIEDHAYGVPRLREALLKDAEQAMVKLAASQREVPVTTEVTVGRPADTIIRAAAHRGSDLIVVGTHGRSAMSRVVMGSVAERVVRHAGCPVLAVRESVGPAQPCLEAAREVPASLAPV